MLEIVLEGKVNGEFYDLIDESASEVVYDRSSGSAKIEFFDLLRIKTSIEGISSALNCENQLNVHVQTFIDDSDISEAFTIGVYGHDGSLMFNAAVSWNSNHRALLKDSLAIINEKYQDFRYKQAKSGSLKIGNTTSRKKRKRNPILKYKQSVYRDIVLDQSKLCYVPDKKEWDLIITFKLIFTPNCVNKFNSTVISFLDVLYPCFPDENRYLNRLPHITSNMVQNHFNNQAIMYTKDRTKKLAQTIELCPELETILDGKLFSYQKETVFWLLNKERYFSTNKGSLSYINGIANSDLIKLLNSKLSFGYFSAIDHVDLGTLFWNRITGFILTKYRAIELLEDQLRNNNGAKGLLAEEMGLGKTFEIMALILINKRRLSINEPQQYIVKDNKIISKCKATLIVCPLSILKQWISEFKLNSASLKVYFYRGFNSMKKEFNTENPQELVEILKKFDVIITSYSIVSSEIHYAQYATSSRSNRRKNLRYDYSSPLSLLQFFRIVLDEVQMLHSGSTKAAKCTSLLHRVHTWGVSGTPIQNIRDFQTVLSYLQIHPFNESDDIIKNMDSEVLQMVATKTDIPLRAIKATVRGAKVYLSSLFSLYVDFDLVYRHCKEDVADEIHIPKQHNMIIPLAFTPIEWDNYLDLWKCFLQESGYNPDGSGKTHMNNILLNQWLSKLRYTCGHAILPEKHNSSHKRESYDVHNLLDILQTMIMELIEKIDGLKRENYILKIRSAQYLMESEENYKDSMCILENSYNEVKAIIKDSIIDTNQLQIIENANKLKVNSVSNVRQRAYLEILHQCEFFLATAHYFRGTFILEVLRDKGQINTIDLNNDSIQWEDILGLDMLEEIKRHIPLEEQYYQYAEKTRNLLLEERLIKVQGTIDEIRNDIGQQNATYLDLVQFDTNNNLATSMSTNNCFHKLNDIISALNAQAEQYNNMADNLTALIYKPIIKNYDQNNEETKNTDYASSIEDQDHIFALFDCMERILKNRDQVLLSEENVKPTKSKHMPFDNLSILHKDLLKSLLYIYCEPLNTMFDELKNIRIVNRITNTPSKKNSDNTFESYLLSFERILEDHRLEIKSRRECLKRYNLVYNSKTEYYAHLQRISDSVTPLSQLDINTSASIIRSIKNDNKYSENCNKMKVLESRLKYLKNLEKLEESIQQNKHGIECTICLQEIKDGAMISCGHIFCKHCIRSWLKNKKCCPLCKVDTSFGEIYSFRFQNGNEEKKEEHIPGDKTGQEKILYSDDKENVRNSMDKLDGIIESKYEYFNLTNEVENMIIHDSFGSKIDFVIKLILFLKHGNELNRKAPPQILIYSQNFDFLKIMSKILNLHNIKNIACLQNNAKIGDAINLFKENDDVTCLLLNSKTLGTGLNLLNATHTFILDPIINQNEELQAINRNNRIGQTRETYVWNFMMTNTVEESIVRYKCQLENLRTKKKFGSNIIGPEANIDMEETAIEDSSGQLINSRHIWNCLFMK
ncbi:hypothetical protein RNJ44_00003 [Nakaseomyces bracarensis]|uniref:Uncharacterized protein n=1 Tax=Nakaseomyces bracarensis TaxID=273131 RepID=A0ABR4P0U1_9SACH